MTTFQLGVSGKTLHNQAGLVGKHLWGDWSTGQTNFSHLTTEEWIDDTKDIECNACSLPLRAHSHHTLGHCSFEEAEQDQYNR